MSNVFTDKMWKIEFFFLKFTPKRMLSTRWDCLPDNTRKNKNSSKHFPCLFSTCFKISSEKHRLKRKHLDPDHFVKFLLVTKWWVCAFSEPLNTPSMNFSEQYFACQTLSYLTEIKKKKSRNILWGRDYLK